MPPDADALIIGAGPAGSAMAILLAMAGWRVIISEQHTFPRSKVCGECISAGNLALLDHLGVGTAFAGLAGPELRQVAWMSAASTTLADLPPCKDGSYPYGRALSRDRLDALLLTRARDLGVSVLQPGRVRRILGSIGRFRGEIDCGRTRPPCTVRASIVIDAHGSWEAGADAGRLAPDPGHLFAFKATFTDASLAPGVLPVFSLYGGYGGIVTADHGRTTLACCIRRDVLQRYRRKDPHTSAGAAVESYLWQSCHGVRDALIHARREGPWLAVGPLRPGIRIRVERGRFRVGNAAGEAHPLIGEGISMALQSSVLLARHLTRQPAVMIDAPRADALQDSYVKDWRAAFCRRMHIANLFAQVAMRPMIARPVGMALQRWPALLTHAARLAGKARQSADQPRYSVEG
jgi:flavin-dependent dehydrogenase